MNRRHLFKLAAAASIAGLGNASYANKIGLRVVVAGAGIIGASIAYHLAKSGVDVVVIDKKGIASHASRGTFAWINASWAKQPQSYHAFNQRGVANWKTLQAELGLPIRWGGSIEWFASKERQDKLAVQIEEQNLWGEAARMIEIAELSKLEPNIQVNSGARFAFSENDGAIDPIIASQLLLKAAQSHGAELIIPSELEDIEFKNGRLNAVSTSTGKISANRLVLATGAELGAPLRFAGIDIPQRSTPGVIALTKPIPRIMQRIIVAPPSHSKDHNGVGALPGVHLHQRDDGRIVLGEQDGASNNTAHFARLKGRPNDFPTREFGLQHGQRMIESAKRLFPAIGEAEIEHAYIGWRPLPIDGHPVLGKSPLHQDVSMAITHSGVTLAPIIGQLLAHELVSGVELSELFAYRPSRKFQKIKRY